MGVLPWLMSARLHSHQGLSGKAGPRGERGPTVSAVDRHKIRGVGWVGSSVGKVPHGRVKALGSLPSSASVEHGNAESGRSKKIRCSKPPSATWRAPQDSRIFLTSPLLSP